MMQQLGGDFPDLEGKPDPADPRNKLKAAELLLDKFKKNITDEEFEERLELDARSRSTEWMKDQEADDRRPAEAGREGRLAYRGTAARDRRRSGRRGRLRSSSTGRRERLHRGGRYAPPSGLRRPVQEVHDRAVGRTQGDGAEAVGSFGSREIVSAGSA